MIFFFSFLALSFDLRDDLVGEWEINNINSDFADSNSKHFTIEFHQNMIKKNSLNGTIWNDSESISVSYFMNKNEPLLFEFEIDFSSNCSGVAYLLKAQSKLCEFDFSDSFVSNFKFGLKEISVDLKSDELNEIQVSVDGEVFNMKKSNPKVNKRGVFDDVKILNDGSQNINVIAFGVTLALGFFVITSIMKCCC